MLLIFADALVRSWKQVTKFKASAGAGAEIRGRAPRRRSRRALPRHSPQLRPKGNGSSAGRHGDVPCAGDRR
jgi:hypothetical protein